MRPELVAEIEYEGFTADGLAAPGIVQGCCGQDKFAEEVARPETPAAATELTVAPHRPPSQRETARGVRFRAWLHIGHGRADLTSPTDGSGPMHDKQPITKLDLARYEAAGRLADPVRQKVGRAR